jgi:hypothetical protein
MKISERLACIEARLEHWDGMLRELQQVCPHESVAKKYRGNTGSWDGDSYWIEFTCQDCGKFWIEDQ